MTAAALDVEAAALVGAVLAAHTKVASPKAADDRIAGSALPVHPKGASTVVDPRIATGAAEVGARSHGAVKGTRARASATLAGMATIGVGPMARLEPPARRAAGQTEAVTGSQHDRSRVVTGGPPAVGERIGATLGAADPGRAARKAKAGARSRAPRAPMPLVVPTPHARPRGESGQDALIRQGVAAWVGKARAVLLPDGVSGATSARVTVRAHLVTEGAAKAGQADLSGPRQASSTPRDARQVTAGNRSIGRSAATAAHDRLDPKGLAAAMSRVAAAQARIVMRVGTDPKAGTGRNGRIGRHGRIAPDGQCPLRTDCEQTKAAQLRAVSGPHGRRVHAARMCRRHGCAMTPPRRGRMTVSAGSEAMDTAGGPVLAGLVRPSDVLADQSATRRRWLHRYPRRSGPPSSTPTCGVN
jgi:hypothetical protein